MTPALLLLLGLPAASPDATVLPARFVADLVFVEPRTRDGRTLSLFTDTGGGLFLDGRAVERLGLKTSPGDEDATFTRLPEFAPGAGIPAPQRNDGTFYVMPAAEAAKNPVHTADGMLGEAWFAGRVWTWDYPCGQLLLEGEGWRAEATATRVPLGFKQDTDGKRATNFPRIAIRIDGKPIDVLLDTGATTVLSEAAMKALADSQPAERATSMIGDSIFQAWRRAHPDWRVIENAQSFSGAAMIEVPEVEIAGARVGPVWFTWRPDANFREYMSGMMDAQVEGAIGGNALRHFSMTVDYPGSAAYFRCIEGCRPVRPPPAP
ncbi:MAG TPA: hypothetical protein VF422_11235 [Dokdonella sp.]